MIMDFSKKQHGALKQMLHKAVFYVPCLLYSFCNQVLQHCNNVADNMLHYTVLEKLLVALLQSL